MNDVRPILGQHSLKVETRIDYLDAEIAIAVNPIQQRRCAGARFCVLRSHDESPSVSLRFILYQQISYFFHKGPASETRGPLVLFPQCSECSLGLWTENSID